MPPLLLASTSPRRKELLALLGLPFDVVAPAYREALQPEPPASQARRFAEGKARAGARGHSGSIVIGSDTVIDFGGQLLGKPQSLDEAREMLGRLRGRRHLVHTAVAVCPDEGRSAVSAVETVQVRMRPLGDEAIERYLATNEWIGKAGSYAIQGHGAALIEDIQGDYLAVVGLPLRLLVQLVSPHLTFPVDVEQLYARRPYPNWSRFTKAGT